MKKLSLHSVTCDDDAIYLVDGVSYPFALIVENTKCIYPPRNPGRATTAPFVMSNFLPKFNVLFGVGFVKSFYKSRYDRYQEMVPGCGFVAIFFEPFQSGKDIFPVALLALKRDTRYAT